MLAWRGALIFFVTATLIVPSGAGAQIAELAKVQAADPVAPYVKASSWVPTGKGPVFVELVLDQTNAGLRTRTVNDQAPEIRMFDSTSDVLKLLADRRMKFLWQPLTEWAGPTLEKMREVRLKRLRAAAAAGDADLPPSTTSESTVRPKTRALIQLAKFLIDVGQESEAERLLQSQLETIKVRTNGSWNTFEWFSIGAWVASARVARGDLDGGISQYALIERTLGSSPFAPNATINRAALLAQSGRYADALAAIDPLWVRWSRENQEYKIRGSDRQFAWIRACALEGLGRHDEAEAAFQPVAQANDTRDPHYAIDSDSALTLRGLVCMKRTAAIKQFITDDLQNSRSPETLLLLQPAYRPQINVELWEKIRSDAGLMKLASERMRTLPPEMTPALNSWH